MKRSMLLDHLAMTLGSVLSPHKSAPTQIERMGLFSVTALDLYKGC
jgi:hypothetical protein